ncbi:MAG: hypothetical protein JKY25_12580 [Robiginitomaculum sp.]|nr:hypothetical protein [Robiginitomaculum sp.]
MNSIAEINSACDCLPLARDVIDRKLDDGAPAKAFALLKSREHLFAKTPVFVSNDDAKAMLAIIAAVEALTQLDGYRDEVFARAGIDAKTAAQNKTQGLFMGYDFHLSPDGPKLIEVNTNAGGAFLVSNLLRAVGPDISCCYNSEVYNAVVSPDGMDEFMADMFKREWAAAGRTSPLKTVAIVDVNPAEQYLYPELLMAKELLESHGIKTIIADPSDLAYERGGLYAGGLKIDIVYNRLTDFGLSETGNISIRKAYEAGDIVLSPAPVHHALYADKRNLILFGDGETLEDWGLAPGHRHALDGVPKTLNLTPKNAGELWAVRKKYFFKPKDGYGSKAAYRGSKITKKVWARISGGTHVAQEFVPPPVRLVSLKDGPVRLKFDLRIYTYAGESFAMAARVYQGQTTNFRTRGGGFAPVIHMRDEG